MDDKVNKINDHTNDPNNEESNEKEEFLKTDLLKDKEPDIQVKTNKEKCSYILKNITVEPTMGLFVLACIVTMLTTQNLKLDKACRVNLNFSSEICDALRLQKTNMVNNSFYETEAQKLVARAMAWRSTITALLPCFLALFIGSWSDLTGHRKIFIIIPILGQMLASINNMLNVAFFYELPLEVLVFSDALIEGLSGSWCIAFMAIFCYISSVTKDDERTFRMGIVNFSLTVGFPIGMGLSGITLRKFGYYGCYGLGVAVHSINLCYNIFWLKDPPRTIEQKKHDGRGIRHFFRTFFDLTNINHTLSVVFGGTKKRRMRMITLLIVVCLLFGPLYGEMSVLYLSTRYRFNWDEVRFSIFQTYNFVAHTVAPLVDILNGTSLLAMRSITSKIVAPNELGKVNSIFSLTENLMPLVYVPLYTRVYLATLDVLPGTVFLVGAFLTLPAVIVFIWLFVEHRIKLRKTTLEGKEMLTLTSKS